ncbi:hypothetical protein AS149_19355 [Burkholderia cenocepacia]|nr:hypothetical protein AS149_19355 [Burkholderia cenocepacia]
MAVKRHADSEMFQVVRAFDDFATMIGGVSQANHFVALCILHQRSHISRGSRLIMWKCCVAYRMNTIFPVLIARLVRTHHLPE